MGTTVIDVFPFPNEIWVEIFEYLSKQDLLNVVVLNNELWPYACHFLYRRVSIAEDRHTTKRLCRRLRYAYIYGFLFGW